MRLSPFTLCLFGALAATTGLCAAAPPALALAGGPGPACTHDPRTGLPMCSTPTPIVLTADIAFADFPFPARFEAQHAIALYDTDGDGALEAPAGASPSSIFPFYARASDDTIQSLGRHIGSPDALLGPFSFDGDVIVIGKMTSGDRTYFLWVALQDPARCLTTDPGCGPRGHSVIDFGAASYRTLSDGSAVEVHHATYVGGIGTSRLDVATRVGPGDFDFDLRPPRAPGPDQYGWLMTRRPGDPWAAMPAPLPRMIAGEPSILTASDNRFVAIDNLSFDVVVLPEEVWDGALLYGRTSWARVALPSVASGYEPPAQQASNGSTLWTSAFANPAGALPPLAHALSIRYGDLDGDGDDDVCGLDGQGVVCALSTGAGFGAPARWSTSFREVTSHVSYWQTVSLTDVTGDGRADVCARLAGGIQCAASTGAAFQAPSWWSTNFRDVDGWAGAATYYGTIRFVDLDDDGRADVCGRGIGGVLCGRSTGSAFVSPTIRASVFSDANGWKAERYGATIMWGDIDGDGDPDVCGRGSGGVWCARNSGGPTFDAPVMWTNQLADGASSPGWQDAASYRTLQLADVNADGRADLCGRAAAGVVCLRSTAKAFIGYGEGLVTAFSDANGWSDAPHYRTIRLADVDGDGRADVCGRGYAGIVCARSASGVGWTGFAAAELQVTNFGDVYGWQTSEAYCGTVVPTAVRGRPGAQICGRGSAGLWCSVR
ncbi:MAG: VCBS repeat-containing protein [Deltaproteobacteria bacterium]|nr:VCBS repeat-containing protein [Deltaproteobacteria bacterium]